MFVIIFYIYFLCGVRNKACVKQFAVTGRTKYKDFKIFSLALQVIFYTRIRYIQVVEGDTINFCIKLIKWRKMDSYVAMGECEQNEQYQTHRA
jgi:hypothetical protein